MKKFLAFIATFLKNTGEKIQSTHTFAQIVSFCTLAGLLFVLFIAVSAHPWTTRAVYYFPEAGKKGVATEIRYIPHVWGLDAKLSLYVSELLLGPGDPGLSPLFPREASLVQAFARKGSAYINLSPEALSPTGTPIDPVRAYELFKKNVCTNFRNIDKIYLYIDGIEVYSRNPFEGAPVKNKKR